MTFPDSTLFVLAHLGLTQVASQSLSDGGKLLVS